MKPYDPKSLEQIAADIAAAIPTAEAPAELQERMKALHEGREGQIRNLRIALLSGAVSWITEGMKAGESEEPLYRAAAGEFEYAAAFLIRGLYRKLGRPFSSARFAIVAYSMADRSDHIFSQADVEEAERLAAEPSIEDVTRSPDESQESGDARYLQASIRDGQASQIMDTVREMDAIVHLLGIEDSHETPSEAIRKLLPAEAGGAA